MKRKLALLLSMAILFTAALPLSGGAQPVRAAELPESEAEIVDPPENGGAPEIPDGSPQEDEEDEDDIEVEEGEENEEENEEEETDTEEEEASDEELDPTPQPTPSMDTLEGTPIAPGAIVLSGVTITLVETGQTVAGLEGVDRYAEISVGYTFTVPDDSQIGPGQWTIITLPDEIILDLDDEETYVIEIPLIGDPDETVIATVTLTDGSSDLLLRFSDDVDAYELTYAYFSITGRFNGDAIGGGERTVLFEYGDDVIEITVRFAGGNSGLSKTLESQGTHPVTGAHLQTWRVAINEDGDTLRDVVLREELDPGLTLIDYYFEGVVNGWSMKGPERDNAYTFTYDGELTDVAYLYLTTQATDLGAFSEWEGDCVLAENRVTLNATGADETPIAELTASAKAPLYAGQIDKSGVGDEAGVISWTLPINERAERMEDLVLYDLVQDGVELDPDSVVVRLDGEELTVGPGPDEAVVYTSAADEGDSVLWQFAFRDTVEAPVTVTYTTRVTSRDTANDYAVTNRAWLRWGAMSSVAVSDSVGGSTGMFTKFGRGYDGESQQIAWGFHINQNFYPITEQVVIEDNYMPSQNVDAGLHQGEPVLEGVWVYAPGESDNGGSKLEQGEHYDFVPAEGESRFTLTIHAGVLDGRRVRVLFHTTVLDWDIVAGNDNKHFYNEATMYLEEQEYPQMIYWNATPRVLNKTNRYNPVGHTITWTLEVNPFNYDGLGEVEVTDRLPDSVALVAVYRATAAGEVLLTPGRNDWNAQGALAYTPSEGDGILGFVWDEGTLDGEAAVLRIVTRVRDEFFDENFERRTITNYAEIEMKNVKESYTVDSSRTLSNTLVGKEGSFDPEMGVIAWEVTVNSNALNWDVAEVVLSDQLPDGLALDVESVRLYRYELIGAETSGDTLYQEGPPIEVPFVSDQAIRYDTASNLFEFTFPSGAPSGAIYRLTFDTDVLESGKFRNEISMTGFGEAEIDDDTVVEIHDGEDDSGALATRKARITLVKYGEDEDAPLAGAVFHLRNEAGDKLAEGVSGANGVIAFDYWLKIGTVYYLHEVEAPTGYVLLSEPIRVYIERGEDGYAVEDSQFYTAFNDREDEEKPPEEGGTPGGSGGNSSGGGNGGSSGWTEPPPPTFPGGEPEPDGSGNGASPDGPDDPDGDGSLAGEGNNDNPGTGVGPTGSAAVVAAACIPAAALVWARRSRDFDDEAEDNG